MSEQIREQVSAFLDGELPNSETELLLKRLTRDGELRESFGRYALIGEAIRGSGRGLITRGFSGRVNLAIDGELVPADEHVVHTRAPRWWRPLAGAAVAAGVDGIFMEVHDNPKEAKSDGANALDTRNLRGVLKELQAVKKALDVAHATP